MTTAAWQAKREDVEAIIGARHDDPFSVLGLHQTAAGWVVRAFVPGTDAVREIDPNGGTIADLKRRDPAGFYEALGPGDRNRFAYPLAAENAGGAWQFYDPYSFGPLLGQLDDHLLVE